MPGSINNLRQIVLIAHNVRSSHNVGSLFRTAEGLAINELVLSGYTPYPRAKHDTRLPYIADKLDNQINKTALGAQNTIKWRTVTHIGKAIEDYRKANFQVLALEQTKDNQTITKIKMTAKIVLIVGNEVTGLENDVLKMCDQIIEIPMLGKKESFNVVQAAAMALFYLRLPSF